MVNIKGANPLGLTLEKGTVPMARASHAAGLAFLTNAAYRYVTNDGKKIQEDYAQTGAAIATIVGMLPTFASSYIDTFEPGQYLFKPGDMLLAAGVVGAAATIGNFTSGQEKRRKRMPEIAASTLMSVPLAIPALYGGMEGVAKAILPYGAVLTGLWLSSKYVPAVRSK